MVVMSTSILVMCKADYKSPSNNVVTVLEKKSFSSALSSER